MTTPRVDRRALVAALYQRNDWFFRVRFKNGDRRFRGIGSFFAMPNSIHRRDQRFHFPHSRPDGDRRIHSRQGE